MERTTRGNTIESRRRNTKQLHSRRTTSSIENLGLRLDSKGSIAGDFVGIYRTAQVEIATAYSQNTKTNNNPGEKYQ